MASPLATEQRDIKRVAIAAATLDNNTIVAAVTGKKILVMSYTLVASGGANTVRWESGASGTALTGQMNLAANGQLVVPYNPGGLLETATGVLLNLELSAATSVAGHLTYQEID